MSEDFMEEKCAPVKRGKGPQELPSQLKPKFPANASNTKSVENTKSIEQPPAKSIEYPAPKTIETPPPVTSKPSELLIPPQQKETSPSPAPTPSPPQQNPQNPPNPPNGPVVPPETAAAGKKMDSLEKELPSYVDKAKPSADQEDAQKKKKKQKQSQPPKKEGDAAQAVFFMEDDKNGTNVNGQFMEDDGDDEKKKKKKEKEKKIPKAPTPSQGGPKTEQPKNEVSLRAKKKDQASSRLNPTLKKEERSARSVRAKKNAAVTSNFQKREPGSARQKQPTAKVIPPVKPVVQPAGQPVQAHQSGAPPPSGANAQKVAPAALGAQEQPTNKESIFKHAFSKARVKFSAFSKYHAGDDTVFATEGGATLRTDVAVVYGVPTDYPKGVIPSSKNDKSHPDRLFPGGRPFWLGKGESRNSTKMFNLSTCALNMKGGAPRPAPPPKLDICPFAENIAELKAKDDAFYANGNAQLIANTVHNVYIANVKAKKDSVREQASKYKRVKFVPPNQCSVYTRKEHRKKQTVTKHAFQPGLKKKITENDTKKKKKRGASSGTSSGPDKSSSTSKLRWQKSTRRISYVKLPSINANKNGKNRKEQKVSTVESMDEPGPSSPSLPQLIPTITPSLCIDNQYFSNYINEKPKPDDVEYLSRAFNAYAKIEGAFHAQRTNYFEKRGLLEALKLNIDQQNKHIGESLGALSACQEITEKYHCTLNSSFETLIEDFAEKAFRLSSLNCQLFALKQQHETNLKMRQYEESRIAELKWRIEREERRIRKLDEKLGKFYESRQKTQNDEEENK